MAMALCFGGGIVEVLERIGHIMDFMKPDLTTVHKEEPLLEIRLCSQHVRALLGWAIAHAAQWNYWRLNKCMASSRMGRGTSTVMAYPVSIYLLKPPLIKELCHQEVRQEGRAFLLRRLWTIIRMYHSIKELLSYSCNSFMY